MEETAHLATEAWFEDPTVWIGVSFILFVALFVKYILPFVTKALDRRSQTIADQLEHANRLRAEAEALLASYKREQQEAEAQATALLAQAQKDAATIRTNAETELQQAIARRTKQAEDTIARAEADAVQQIRTKLVELATDTARDVIAAQLKDAKEDPAIARALQSIEHNLH